MNNFYPGYRLDLENRSELKRTSTRLPRMSFRAPAEIFPDWLRMENQGSQGSCAGQSNANVGEVCYWIDTRGDITQFSAKFSYIVAQKLDGITGDQGATINSSRRASMEYGYCPEDLCPYTERYDNRISQEAIKAAKDFKIRSHTLLRNYDDVFAYLASGQGGVQIGIAWPDAWMECDGVLESFRPGQGGHAIALLGYSKNKDRSGRNYIWLCNSWSEQWGNRGWAEVSPAAVDQFSRHQDTVMCGYSDLSVDDIGTVRDFDWTGGM